MSLAESATFGFQHSHIQQADMKAGSQSVLVTINRLLTIMAGIETMRIIEETLFGTAAGIGKRQDSQLS